MTAKYALIGHPVKHSLSPLIHAHFAAATAQDMRYELLDVMPENFERAVAEFRDAGGMGLNVTLPHKGAGCAIADQVSHHAKLAQAANTLLFVGKKTHAHNTDGVGLTRDLSVLEFPVAQRKILILGAGGACRGIIVPLLETGATAITIANRTPNRAEELATRMSSYGDIRAIALSKIKIMSRRQFDVIINATSASLQNTVPPLPDVEFEWGYDLAYAKQGTTAFVESLEARGIKAQDGLGMLIEQAAASFHLWRDIRPDTHALRSKIKTHLARHA